MYHSRHFVSYRAGHEWTHLTVCAWVRHNIVPSILAGGCGCSPRTAMSSRLYGQLNCDRQRHVLQLGPRGAHGAGTLIDQRWSGCPSRHARPTPLSAGHQGMAQGFVQGNSWCGVRCGRFVSCREVGAGYFSGVGSSCRKWNVAVSGHRDRAAQGIAVTQSARFG